MTGRRFGIVGAGRVGLALAHHAAAHGFRLVWAVDIRPEVLSTVKTHFHCTVHGCIGELTTSEIDICIIAVGDEAIADVAKDLAIHGVLREGTLVFHTSGARGAAELLSLSEKLIHTGAIHPIQSFADTAGNTPLEGIGCGVEGSDEFCERAFELAAAFGWRALRIDTESKALYHAACVFAGNFPTVLAAQAAELLRASTPDTAANTLPYLLPMMETVLRRLHTMSPEASLTGPAARAQSTVVRTQHGHILSHDPLTADVYRSLSLAAATLAGLTPAALSRLREAMDE
jgi:predicted short-subunit dehydrogenase-like oxidoreductase (DUF2520 family)